GPPPRPRPEPGVLRVAEEFRRIEGGQVRAVPVVVALEGRPGGVDDERGQAQEDEQRLGPPGVPAGGLAETPACHRQRYLGHEADPPGAWDRRNVVRNRGRGSRLQGPTVPRRRTLRNTRPAAVR